MVNTLGDIGLWDTVHDFKELRLFPRARRACKKKTTFDFCLDSTWDLGPGSPGSVVH